jgi:hypothetical protein
MVIFATAFGVINALYNLGNVYFKAYVKVTFSRHEPFYAMKTIVS